MCGKFCPENKKLHRSVPFRRSLLQNGCSPAVRAMPRLRVPPAPNRLNRAGIADAGVRSQRGTPRVALRHPPVATPGSTRRRA
jgi:hypothetical protein